MKVSEEAVLKVEAELIVNRAKKRAIQQMTTKELTTYLVRIYRIGFEDGATACEEAAKLEAEKALPFEEVQVDWDDVLSLIREVKGIGPKTVQAIDSKLKEVFQ